MFILELWSNIGSKGDGFRENREKTDFGAPLMNVFWLRKVLETLFLAEKNRNGHVYIKVMKQHRV